MPAGSMYVMVVMSKLTPMTATDIVLSGSSPAIMAMTCNTTSAIRSLQYAAQSCDARSPEDTGNGKLTDRMRPAPTSYVHHSRQIMARPGTAIFR